MRILGVDPGTAIVGFGIIDSDGQNHKMVEAGVVRTPANQALELRLKSIYESFSQLIEEYKPDIEVIEKLYFARNVTTAISVSHARGVIILSAAEAGVAICEYTPLQIKQALTGYGRAEKNQIGQMVKSLLKLKNVPKPDDCADALAAALTHATASLLYSKQ